MKNVIVLGATGATGRCLLTRLMEDDQYDRIHVVHYRDSDLFSSSKIIKHIGDFSSTKEYDFGKIDAIFCCVGTTIKKAGSQEAFLKVDKELVLNWGSWAKDQNVHSFHVISAVGANRSSFIFYNRTKGEMEYELENMDLKRLFIYQPPLLLANREEKRLGEVIAQVLYKVLSPILKGPLKRFNALHVDDLAKKMIEYESSDLNGLVKLRPKELIE